MKETVSASQSWAFLNPPKPDQSEESFAENADRRLANIAAKYLLAIGQPKPFRSLCEGLNAVSGRNDGEKLQALLELFDVAVRLRFATVKRVDEQALPCLCFHDDGDVSVVARVDDDIIGRDVFSDQSRSLENDKRCWILESVRTQSGDVGDAQWIDIAYDRVMKVCRSLLTASLVVNVLALATPIFVMTVYDRVIGNSNNNALLYLLPGILIVLVADSWLRRLRSQIAQIAAADLSSDSNTQLFAQLLSLPARLTERATLTSQLSRIKSFESVLRVATGSALISLIDAPFSLLFVVAIAYIGGSIVFVPLFFALLFVIAIFWFTVKQAKNDTKSSRLQQMRQELVTEVVEKPISVHQSGSRQSWREKFADVTEHCASSNYDNTVLQGWSSSVGQLLTMGAGLMTVLVGIGKVIDQSMTAGSLIACVMLTWRVFAPLQAMMGLAPRIRQARRSMQQVRNFMNIETEQDARVPPVNLPDVDGHIEFEQLTFRYGVGDPELSNVNFALPAGEILVVMGKNGSGKSTILKLIAGIHYSQTGRLLLDGRNLRQLNPAGLRRAVTYLPQMPRLVSGTIRDNLLLAEPRATDEALLQALCDTGASGLLDRLPDGLDTHVGPRQADLLTTSDVAKIALARAWIRPASIVLLDEPTVGLDFESEYQVMESINRRRGDTTIVLVTHRLEHLAMADKALLLDKGTVRFFGSAVELSEKIKPEHL